MITRRKLAAGMVASAPFMIGPSLAASTATFVVPRNVHRIRVRSYKGGTTIMDTVLSVEPGQTFKIDAV